MKHMIKLVEMDEKVTLSEQLRENVEGTVILINKFNVKPEEVDHFLMTWAVDADTLGSSQDSFPHNCIEVLEEALCSSTMPFGNLLSCTRGI
jgi:hypothetical protein